MAVFLFRNRTPKRVICLLVSLSLCTKKQGVPTLKKRQSHKKQAHNFHVLKGIFVMFPFFNKGSSYYWAFFLIFSRGLKQMADMTFVFFLEVPS